MQQAKQVEKAIAEFVKSIGKQENLVKKAEDAAFAVQSLRARACHGLRYVCMLNFFIGGWDGMRQMVRESMCFLSTCIVYVHMCVSFLLCVLEEEECARIQEKHLQSIPFLLSLARLPRPLLDLPAIDDRWYGSQQD